MPDNLLHEFELAVTLAREKRINIFPVLIGGGRDHKLDVNNQITLFDFSEYGPQNFPQNPSTTSPVKVSSTITSILSFQGVKLLDAIGMVVYQKVVRDGTQPLSVTHLIGRILQVRSVIA